MHLSVLFSAVSLLQLSALTSAHGGDDEIPRVQVFGGRAATRHLPRHVVDQIESYAKPHHAKRDWGTPDSDSKDGKHKRCGAGLGYCDPGDCCSPVGYCGRGFNHCASPNCQFQYSDGCDASVKPLGEETLNVPRPLIGNVSYEAAGIDHCSVPGTVSLTFDDGPYNYTSHVLDALASANAKATFFITGNNLGKGQIDIEETGWPDLIRRMHADGHQIAGHSWGHANMSSLNETMMVQQVLYLEMAIRNILGFIPTYWRPPYDDCTSEVCQRVLKRMGYHISYQNVVNKDWQSDTDQKIEGAKELFMNSMRATNAKDVNYIFLLHDTHYQTSWNLTGYMLDYFQLFNYSRLVTLGECMGDPKENWYRAAGGAADKTLLQKKKSSDGGILQYGSLLLVCAQVLAFMLL